MVIKVAVVIVFIVARLDVHQPGQLHALHSARTPASSASSAGAASWRGAGIDLLRLHRLRRGLHRGAGGQEPAADMPIGIIGSLAVCTLLYVLFSLRAHRHGELQGTGQWRRRWRWPSTRHRTCVAEDADQAGDHRRVHVGDPGDAAGQSRVFYSMSRDGLLPKFSPTSIRSSGRRGAPTCCSWLRFAARASCRFRRGPHDQHRHAVRLRHGLRRRSW